MCQAIPFTIITRRVVCIGLPSRRPVWVWPLPRPALLSILSKLSPPPPCQQRSGCYYETYFNPESGVQARTIKSNAVDQQTTVFWISIYEEKISEKCDPRGQRRPGLVTRFALQMTPRTWDQWTLGDGGHWRGWGQWG